MVDTVVDDHSSVFHLITRLIDGGAEAVLMEIVTELDGYEFTVGHGTSYQESRIETLANTGVKTVEFPFIRHYNPVTAFPAVVSLARHLKREEYDIVHTHSTEAGIIGRFAAALAGVPNVVHTVHGIPFADDRNALLNQFVTLCERSAAKYTDRILTNADIMAQEYLERGIGEPEQYRTVRAGVDLQPFRSASPATDLPGEPPRVTMIGRLAAGKGFDVLLDAVEAVETEKFSVCLVGDGPLRDELARSIDERGLQDTVSLLGYRDDVPAILAASDVFVLPSFREGTPRSITEAMASGLPVVATDIAGIPEQVRDGESGYLVPTGDPGALAERLEQLLADAQMRAQMGNRGRERAKQFSAETMLEDLDELYEDLLPK